MNHGLHMIGRLLEAREKWTLNNERNREVQLKSEYDAALNALLGWLMLEGLRMGGSAPWVCWVDERNGTVSPSYSSRTRAWIELPNFRPDLFM